MRQNQAGQPYGLQANTDISGRWQPFHRFARRQQIHNEPDNSSWFVRDTDDTEPAPLDLPGYFRVSADHKPPCAWHQTNTVIAHQRCKTTGQPGPGQKRQRKAGFAAARCAANQHCPLADNHRAGMHKFAHFCAGSQTMKRAPVMVSPSSPCTVRLRAVM